MTQSSAVQLKDGAGMQVRQQFYDAALDAYQHGTALPNPALAGNAIMPAAVTALVDGVVLKNSACNFLGANVCTTSQAGYVMLFNAAAIPANGAVTPVKVWPLAANTGLEIDYDPPLRLSAGVVLAFSSTGPFLLTKSATAFISGEVA